MEDCRYQGFNAVDISDQALPMKRALQMSTALDSYLPVSNSTIEQLSQSRTQRRKQESERSYRSTVIEQGLIA
jgi:hypothetical protein